MSKWNDIVQSIRTLRAQGMGANEIAAVLNISFELVQKEIHRMLDEDIGFESFDQSDY